MPIPPHFIPLPAPDGPLGPTLRGAFAQPEQQALPRDFLAMLVTLDRAKRRAR